MIKNILSVLARKAGLFIKEEEEFINKISVEPLNAAVHLQYAIYALNNNQPYLALAELKTSEFLGTSKEKVSEYKARIISGLPDPEVMDHNEYYRFRTLSTELNLISCKSNYSVLDVGGGQGKLASFIPDASYCLAEPSINGISGINLPFTDHFFDYVVSCHVLEHVPAEKRVKFLDQLLSKSKFGLILLNPFYIEGTHVNSGLKLILNITGADWAKEHLEYTLPSLSLIEKYAEDKDLDITIKPNGSLTTSMALVFVDYFSEKSGQNSAREKINKFYNMKFENMLDNDKFPTAYMVYLRRKTK